MLEKDSAKFLRVLLAIKEYIKKRKEKLISTVSKSNGNIKSNRKIIKTRKQIGRKMTMDNSSNKLAKLYTIKAGHSAGWGGSSWCNG